MNALIATTEDRARLLAEARSWLGTPYAADGAVKGAGVSCSLLPYEILRACGHAVPRPPARVAMPKVSILDFMRAWLEGAPTYFAPVPPTEMTVGDVALMHAGMGHLLMRVDPNNFVHCWKSGGVQFASVKSPIFSLRIRSVWRPIVST